MVALGPAGSCAGGGGGAALLAGVGVNQDGRSGALTAPHGPSQQAVVRAALAEAALTGADVAALQMHGTGTALGDPIEVGAARAAFVVADSDVRSSPPPLMCGAVKGWVGHGEPAVRWRTRLNTSG